MDRWVLKNVFNIGKSSQIAWDNFVKSVTELRHLENSVLTLSTLHIYKQGEMIETKGFNKKKGIMYRYNPLILMSEQQEQTHD